MDQVISIAIALVSLALMVVIGGVSTARGRRAAANPGAGMAGGGGAAGEPAWPDPETRPRI
jgi:hypothetical protein